MVRIILLSYANERIGLSACSNLCCKIIILKANTGGETNPQLIEKFYSFQPIMPFFTKTIKT